MLTCREIVELVTDYLDRRLSLGTRLRVLVHLAMCRGCRAYLSQIRHTIRALGMLPSETVDPAVRQELVARFRAWKH